MAMEDYEPGCNHIYAIRYDGGSFVDEYIAIGSYKEDALEALGQMLRGSQYTFDRGEYEDGIDTFVANGMYVDEAVANVSSRLYPVNGGMFYIEIPQSIECLDGYIDPMLLTLIGGSIQSGIDQWGQPSRAKVEDVRVGVDESRPQYVLFTAQTQSRYGPSYSEVYKKPDSVRRGILPWQVL